MAKVDGKFYREKIIKCGLLPFLKDKYPNKGCVFWPKLVTLCSCNARLQYLEEAGIPFLKKEENPPNVPQFRPIEDMWGINKKQVYRGGWTATSEQQLITKIRSTIRSLNTEVPRKMKNLNQRVRRADRHGLLSAVH